ncbi:hypothetical protein ACTA71_010616 [Dictyostelium dimigraforme]
MKLFSLLIIVLLLNIIITTTAIDKISPTYVNFIPYKTGFNCQGKIDGLGYSLAIDSCISFDGYVTSWEFSWNQNTGAILGIKYDGICKPSNRNSTSPYRYLNMGCDRGGNIVLDPTTLPTQPYDYRVQISTSPIYPAKSLYLITQRLGGCTGIVIAYEFLTNETIAIAPGKIAYTYYCMPNGLPKMMDDGTGIIYQGDSCNLYRGFFNSSSDTPFSGTSGSDIIKNGGGGGGSKNKIGNSKGGIGSIPFISFDQLISFGVTGSGDDTASGVSTAQPTTAQPTTADSTTADSTTGYSTSAYSSSDTSSTGGEDTNGGSTGYSTGGSTQTSTSTGADTGNTSNESTGADTGNTSNESTGVTSTSGNDSGGSTTTTGSSSANDQEIFLTNTCSSVG